jgi:hypothetical protein
VARLDSLTKDAPNSKTSKEDNSLHKFSSYNCLFTLSGLTETEIKNPEKLFTNPVHDVIARSSGIGQNKNFADDNPFQTPSTTGDGSVMEAVFRAQANKNVTDRARQANTVLKRNHDIFFEEVVITSVHTPNEERSLMNFTKMEFELHEPLGTTLIEKCRAAAFNCGYIDHLDAPFLLTIEWKGYDSNGNPVIGKDQQKLVRKIPISISRVEFEVNEGGTKYSLIAVAYAEQAAYSRFLYTRYAHLGLEGNTMDKFCENLQNHLNDKMNLEIANNQRQYRDIYDIKVSDAFSTQERQFDLKKDETLYTSSPGTASSVEGETTNPDYYTQGKIEPDYVGYKQDVAINTAISKILEDAMKAIPIFKNKITNFWDEYSKTLFSGDNSEETFTSAFVANSFVRWFKIKTTVHTDTSVFDTITRMHPKTIIFRIEPYDVHVLKFMRPGIHFGNVPWDTAVKKEYNYIYTGDNVDIENLRIYYKAAWYQSNLSDQQNVEGTALKGDKGYQTNLVGQSGKTGHNQLELRGYPSITKQETDNYGPNAVVDQFMDYLTNPMADMIRLDMDILGDPAYIAQDAFLTYSESALDSSDTSGWVKLVNGDTNRTSWSYKFDCLNYDTSMPIVSLKYRLPTDFDENTGVYYQSAGDANLTFTGVYEVARVESRISSGSFRQRLTMVRLPNQSGNRQLPVKRILDFDAPIPDQSQSGLGGKQETDYNYDDD